MGARRAGATALAVLAYVFRFAGIALCALTCALCFSGVAAQLGIVGIVVDLSRAIPSAISGYGVVASPFGGVFRLDFAIVAAVFYALDYACVRVSSAIR